MTKVIIIGAVAAGSKAAAKLRRLRPDFEIVVYTKDTNVAYSSCGLPYYIGGSLVDINKLIIRTPEDFAKSEINVFIRHEVQKILTELKTIQVKNLLTNEVFYTSYDKLIIATGSSPIIPNIKNVGLKNIFTLRTLEEGYAIKNKLLQSNRALIVGAGYIGIELLEAFVKQGVSTTIIDPNKKVMPKFDDEISDKIQKYILQKNLEKVEIINEDYVEEFVGENFVQGVITKNGRNVDVDLVVLCTGVKPNVEIVKEAGIELGVTGAIKVNERMQTSKEDIYACGDCVQEWQIVAQAPCWLPLGTNANKEGRCAAINVAGEVDKFEGVLGSAVTQYFDLTISTTGLSEKEAIKYGFEPVSVVVSEIDKAGYMPNASYITAKMIADKNTQRILGVQAVGSRGADKRVNIISTALLAKMTLKEFLNADITYAPPFSTSIDLMLTLSQKLLNKIERI